MNCHNFTKEEDITTDQKKITGITSGRKYPGKKERKRNLRLPGVPRKDPKGNIISTNQTK